MKLVNKLVFVVCNGEGGIWGSLLTVSVCSVGACSAEVSEFS